VVTCHLFLMELHMTFTMYVRPSRFQIYIQWCKVPSTKNSHDKHAPHDDLHDPPSHHSHSHGDGAHQKDADGAHSAHEAHIITDEIAFSSACETKWFGPLVT